MLINGRAIGSGNPVFVIAEAGINHNGSIELAKELIDIAALAGADAVKFQKRSTDVVYTQAELAKPRPIDRSFIEAARQREHKYGYRILSAEAWERINSDPENTTNDDQKRILEFGKPEYDEIDTYCKKKGILWTASPWDEESVEFLEQYEPPFYKIASPSSTDRALIERVKSKGRPVIVSLGMLTDTEIAKLALALDGASFAFLHCTSTYPSELKDLNLAAINTLEKWFPKTPIGYSGHEVGVIPSIVAATRGASIIERHITKDRALPGSDQAASIEKRELVELVEWVKAKVPAVIGSGALRLEMLPAEVPIAAKLRRTNTL